MRSSTRILLGLWLALVLGCPWFLWPPIAEAWQVTSPYPGVLSVSREASNTATATVSVYSVQTLGSGHYSDGLWSSPASGYSLQYSLLFLPSARQFQWSSSSQSSASRTYLVTIDDGFAVSDMVLLLGRPQPVSLATSSGAYLDSLPVSVASTVPVTGSVTSTVTGSVFATASLASSMPSAPNTVAVSSVPTVTALTPAWGVDETLVLLLIAAVVLVFVVYYVVHRVTGGA